MDDSAHWLAAVVESSDDAIVAKTLSGFITSWNPAAERLFGYTAAEAIGRPVAMLVPPDRADEEPRILARIANGERVHHFETVRVRKDGSPVHVSVTISPVRDASGRIVGASKIARNIEDQKRAEARVQAQLARLNLLDQVTRAIGEHHDLRSIHQVALRSVEERMPLDFACICAVDEATRNLVLCHVGVHSASLARDLAIAEGGLVPLEPAVWDRWTSGGLVYEPDLRGAGAPLAQRLDRGGLGCLVIAPLKEEGRVVGLLMGARKRPDAFSSNDCEFLLQLSTHIALAATHAQLTASLKRAYDDLKASQEESMRQQRLRAMGEMASGIAHDIGNLVFPATFFARELKDRESGISAGGREQLDTVVQALEDVGAIVGRLREFYRAREVSLQPRPFDLNAAIAHVVMLARPWCAQRSARAGAVDVQAALCEPSPRIDGSESEIREALVNLVLNALDAMPQGGTVHVRSRRYQAGMAGAQVAGAEVVVEDDGMGMDPETLRRCMDPFFTTKGDSGTGMGLAMVYATAQRHGARIAIDSAPGRGTSISVRFPPERMRSPSPPRPVASPVVPGGRALRVLLVDDDPLVLETLQLLLHASGHATAAACGGQAGLDVFRDAMERGAAFDVVVTDLGMPNVDGRAVARSIKQMAPSMPIVLLTGWGEGSTRGPDDSPPVDAILGKPPSRADLNDTLARVTRSQGHGP